jgi:hypothetical protein
MKKRWGYRLIAISGLILIMVLALLFASGKVSSEEFSAVILAGSLVWFVGILLANRKRA